MILRTDYRAPDFLLDRVELDVCIDTLTTVDATLHLRRSQHAGSDTALHLDGRAMQLQSLELDGQALSTDDYRVEPERLVIRRVPAAFTLRIRTLIDPESNRALEGWYRSGPMLCTQCEAQGFSRITYALDRPDVLSRYRVRLEADLARFPVLLANGNCVASGPLADGRHFAVWDDPFLKPCYLFAMVAGDLACVEGEHVTGSGRRVALRFYVDHGNQDRVGHAMESLRKAMRWDEQVYGLEYDLDTYMVVAAREFNAGAMENKGLNLFNARFVLASPETATDEDYAGVESVIAHEYFHNWTGNRVTCRDWFQLSLKEGLTVFRDQCFSADQGSRHVNRIEDVRNLRAVQFPEDEGPTAHPVRPDAYSEVNNLYTATVYEKGAEVVRMLYALLGHQTFVRGVRRYLAQFDGQAATVEDFIAAHEAESGHALEGFRRWYSQSGTPVIEIADEYDAATGEYRVRLSQRNPATHDQKDKLPLPIPIRFGLRGPDGREITVAAHPPLLPEPGLILLDAAVGELVFKNIPVPPTPVFLHGFSAPVTLRFCHQADALTQLLLHEDDGFVRWEAAQQLMLRALHEHLRGALGAVTAELVQALQTLAHQPPADKALLAELLRLPPASELAVQLDPLDPIRLSTAREALRLQLAHALTGPLSVWASWAPMDASADSVARRRLSNLALNYLGAIGVQRVRGMALERAALPSMSLAMGALRALNDADCEQRDQAMAAFHGRFRGDPLVLDKWFALQAASLRNDGLTRVRQLLTHPDYVANPNRIRAVLGTFARDNLPAFHGGDGAGYRLLAEQVLQLDAGNPQLASRLVEPLLRTQRLTPAYLVPLRAVQADLAGQKLSRGVREKLAKALEEAQELPRDMLQA